MVLIPTHPPVNTLRLLSYLGLMGVISYLFALYSLALTVINHDLTPLWFTTAILTVSFFRWSRRYWPAIAISVSVATLLACLTLDSVTATDAGLIVINNVEALIAAMLLRRWLSGNDVLVNLNQWFKMAIACSVIAPLVGTILMLYLTGQQVSPDLFTVWLLSKSIPALALVPIGLLYRGRYSHMSGYGAAMFESVITLIVTLVLATLALFWLPWPFAFTIVLLIWSAIRLPRLAAFTVFFITLIVISSLTIIGPVFNAFANPQLLNNASWLPFLLILLPANVMSIVMYGFRSERKRIADSEIRFRNAMEYSAIGMALVSIEGRWLEVNRALSRFLNYPTERLEQLTFQEITWPEDLDADLAQLSRLERGEIQSFSMEKRYITGQGNVVWGRLSTSIVRHHDRSPDYFIAQIQDITELKMSEQRNQHLMERITLANEAGGVGIWEWDLRNDTISWDKRMFELYELDRETALSYACWHDRIVSEDRQQVDSAINRALASQRPLEMEFRIQTESGIRHIRSLARRVREPEKNVDRLLGINMDMTEVKQLNEALFQEKERLHITLTSIGEAVICIDTHQHITFMNPVAEKLVGCSQDEAMGQNVLDVVTITDGENGSAILELDQPCRAPHAIEEDVILHNRLGASYDVHYSVTPLNAFNGKQQGWVMVIHDISESRKMLRQLSYSASHDSLTGLANRVSFENALKRILSALKERHHALIYIDLDRFKTVNDNAGHAAGDFLLREIAGLMQRQIRPGDVLARLGGDEFGLLLPDCTLDDARSIAGRIVFAINHYQLRWQGKEYTVGASAGFTAINNDNRIASELLSQADIACYDSKHAGRGRVSQFVQPCQPQPEHARPSLTTHRELIATAPVTFNVWPVAYARVPEAAGFWLIEPHLGGLDAKALSLTSLFSQADRQTLEIAQDKRVISEFFTRYVDQIAARGIGVALPISLATLSHTEPGEALFARIAASPLPPRLLHIVLCGDAALQQAPVSNHLARLKSLGCELIYSHASRDPEIFNHLPRQIIDYLLLDEALTGDVGDSVMDEMMVTILQGHAQRMHIRTIAGAVHSAQTASTLSGIGVTMLYGQVIARRQLLDDLLASFLFGIH